MGGAYSTICTAKMKCMHLARQSLQGTNSNGGGLVLSKKKCPLVLDKNSCSFECEWALKLAMYMYYRFTIGQ